MNANLIFEDRILPDGSHVLVPKICRPRTCRRADGIAKRTYATADDAERGRSKRHVSYRCPNCGSFHRASK